MLIHRIYKMLNQLWIYLVRCKSVPKIYNATNTLLLDPIYEWFLKQPQPVLERWGGIVCAIPTLKPPIKWFHKPRGIDGDGYPRWGCQHWVRWYYEPIGVVIVTILSSWFISFVGSKISVVIDKTVMDLFRFDRYILGDFVGVAEEAQTGMPAGVTLLIDALNQAHAFIWFYCFIILSTVAYCLSIIYTQQRHQLRTLFGVLVAAHLSYTTTTPAAHYFQQLLHFSSNWRGSVSGIYVYRVSYIMGRVAVYITHTGSFLYAKFRHQMQIFFVNGGSQLGDSTVGGVLVNPHWLVDALIKRQFEVIWPQTCQLELSELTLIAPKECQPPTVYSNPFFTYDNWLVECIMLALPTFILLAMAAPITSLHYSVEGLSHITSAELNITGRQWAWNNSIVIPITTNQGNLLSQGVFANRYSVDITDLHSPRQVPSWVPVGNHLLVQFLLNYMPKLYHTVLIRLKFSQSLYPCTGNFLPYECGIGDDGYLFAGDEGGLQQTNNPTSITEVSGTGRLPCGTTTNQQGLTNIATPLPAFAWTRAYVDSLDVIHSLWAWSYGIKIDCIPDNPTQTTIFPKHYSLSVGNCAEYCGVNHNSMGMTFRAYDLHIVI